MISLSEQAVGPARFLRPVFWRQIQPLLGNSRRAVAALVIGSVLGALAESGILAIVAQSAAALVDQLTRVRIALGPVHLTESIGVLLGVALALVIFRLALQVVLSFIPARIAADLRTQLSTDLLAAFTRAAWDLQSRDREGHLQELSTNQVMQATSGASYATALVSGAITFLVLIVSAFTLNPLAAAIVLGAASGLFAILRPLTNRASRNAQAVSSTSLTYASGVNEAVRLAEETQVFGVGASQRDRLTRLVAQVRRPFFNAQVLLRVIPSVYQNLLYLLLVGALLVLDVTGTGHLGSLGAVVLLLIRAGGYGQQAQAGYLSVGQALPYLERIHTTLDGYLQSTPSSGTRRLRSVSTIALDNVSFAYNPGRPVLSDISFEVSSGETVGIIGPTGVGKSTLIQILLRLRSPDAGQYLVNRAPAVEFRREDWHKAFAYLPQEPRLLHASVADNIRFFRNLNDEVLEEAARLAGIHDDITGWPAGYDTIVGPRADAVSGGQQQRICLARALAARPEVLVLDEPTSALDPHTELVIQESLRGLNGAMTLFVIAHRMSTLDSCERVMVIVDGRLQAFDTRDGLMGSNAYYRSASALPVATVPADGTAFAE